MTGFSHPALYLALAALILMLGGALLLVRGGGGERLRARIQTLCSSQVVVTGMTPSIRIAAADDRRWSERMLRLLGYNPAIPRSHAMSLPMVLLLAGAVGLAVQLRTQSVVGAPPAAALGVVVALVLAVVIWRRQARRYREELFRQLPDVLGQVVRAVRAGLPVNDALRRTNPNMLAPSQGEFAKVVGDTAIGVPLEAALWNLYRRVGLTEFAFVAITIGLQAQTGGNLTESLGNLADMTRKRVSAATKARALAAEARASATILGALPFVCALALVFLNPDYVLLLFSTALGNKLLLVFTSMMLAGMLTIRWLIQRSTQD